MSLKKLFRYSHTIGFLADDGGGKGFSYPVDLAISTDGVLYVLNRGGPDMARKTARRVTMCTLTEEYLGEFGIGGDGDGELFWPVSIAVSPDGNIYISDEALHRISIFDNSKKFIGKWGVKGEAEGQFHRPAGIAFDRDNNLLVVDSVNNRIQRYTKDGLYLGGWGRRGTGDGEFNLPWGICCDRQGNVYVADWRNDRIQKFDHDGNYVATLGKPGRADGEFHRPAAVAVDPDGDIYVADWGNERVQVFDSDGSLLAGLRGDAGLSKWSQEYFDNNEEELGARLSANMEPELDLWPDDDPREASASIEKLLWGPTSIKIDGEGRILIVDSARYRIQIYHKEAQSPAEEVSVITDTA